MSVSVDKIHILLTGIGLRAEDSFYSLGKNKEQAKLSPLALLKLLPAESKPNKIVALCTEKATNIFEDFLKREAGIPCEKVPISEARTESELWKLLQKIMEEIPEGCDLTLDLTQGLRHFPFLFFTAALYVRALKKVNIRGAYYGMFEAKVDNASPMVDLSPALDMVNWFQAIQVFRDTGNAQPLAQCFQSIEKYEKEGKHPIQESLEDWNMNMGAALPLEVGKSAIQLLHAIGSEIPGEIRSRIPSSDLLIEHIQGVAAPFSLPEGLECQGKWKKKIPFGATELDRQAHLIEFYLEKGHLNNAAGLIREWMVSRVLLTISGSDWLNLRNRRKTERLLHIIRECKKKQEIHPDRKPLSEMWDKICQTRNALHHHGMREDAVQVGHFELVELWEKMKSKAKEDAFWSLVSSDEMESFIQSTEETVPMLLVSALGMSKGLLYSALSHIACDECLIVGSVQSLSFLDEIVQKSGYKGKINTRTMQDPFLGFKESEEIIYTVEELLLSSRKIVINITGGTTAQQFVIQSICDRAREFEKETLRVAFIDRRDVSEQRSDPYVKGEMVELSE